MTSFKRSFSAHFLRVNGLTNSFNMLHVYTLMKNITLHVLCTCPNHSLYFPLFSVEWHKLNQEYIGHASAFGWGLIRLLKPKIVNNFSVQCTKMEKPCYHYFYIHTRNMECRDSRRDKLLLCSHIPGYILATPI